ncbi:hypothetical protein BGX38DRAFT_1330203 [Terfezia claveryi]|nr:hypothetical protein BGX38DRAFT_1330203 [Terfezia claveryi]
MTDHGTAGSIEELSTIAELSVIAMFDNIFRIDKGKVVPVLEDFFHINQLTAAVTLGHLFNVGGRRATRDVVKIDKGNVVPALENFFHINELTAAVTLEELFDVGGRRATRDVVKIDKRKVATTFHELVNVDEGRVARHLNALFHIPHRIGVTFGIPAIKHRDQVLKRHVATPHPVYQIAPPKYKTPEPEQRQLATPSATRKATCKAPVQLSLRTLELIKEEKKREKEEQKERKKVVGAGERKNVKVLPEGDSDDELLERCPETNEECEEEESTCGPWVAKGNAPGYLDSDDERELDGWGERRNAEKARQVVKG